MSLLSLHELRVRVGTTTILDLPELSVEPGEILVVLGPTGAGKSTLLRVMALIQRPTDGSLAWQGTILDHPAPLALRRRIAMVFQDPLLFTGSVRDNVGYGLRVRRLPHRDLRARVDEAMNALRIAHLESRKARTLSGGEAQRTALARALVLRPDLLLLDEPLASLDEPIREELRDELVQLLRRHGITCVFVTHDQDEALTIADRIAILDHGKLLQLGPTDEVFRRPNSVAAAQFLQMANIVPGRVVDRRNGCAIVDLGGQRLLAESAVAVGSAVRLCVRPEDVELAPPRGEHVGPNELAGRIVATATRGAMTRVTIDCGVSIVAMLPRRAGASENPLPGGLVTVRVAPSIVHLIATGEGKADADA